MKKKARREVLRVVGYTRVSTIKQVETGVSLDIIQPRQIEEECARRKWELVAILSDRGKSAKTMSREGMDQALAMLSDGRADALMFAKCDRATRSVRDLYDLMDRSSQQGWTLVDLETNFDSSDPTGRMIAGMRGVVAQWEREMIGKRTKDALAEKKAQGVRLGRPPSTPDESIAKVARLRGQGLTVRAIAAEMGWHPTSVQRVLSKMPIE